MRRNGIEGRSSASFGSMVLRRALIVLPLIIAACTNRTNRPLDLPSALPAEPRLRVEAIATHVESRWPGVRIGKARISDDGSTVIFDILSADFGVLRSYDAYAARVRRLGADQRQASVELLVLTARALPELELVSVYEDSWIMPFWSPEQIARFRPPASYRSFDAYTRLIRDAKISPLRRAG